MQRETQREASHPGFVHLMLGSAVTEAAMPPTALPLLLSQERLGEIRSSLSLFPGLFPKGEAGQLRLGPVLRLTSGVGSQSQGPGDNSIQRFRVRHAAWAGGLFPGTVRRKQAWALGTVTL